MRTQPGRKLQSTAREFVNRGIQKGELAIISEEKVAPYERPALSKGYLFKENPARLPGFHTTVGTGGDKQTADWYAKHGITLLLGKSVLMVDAAKHSVALETGESIKFDNLIYAPGSVVVKLESFGVKNADAKNVFYLRGVQHADEIVAAMKSHPNGKAVVVGGGYIGMECTAGLVVNGLNTTMVFPEPHLMPRLFNKEIADFYEFYYQQKGVQFVKGTVVTAIDVDKEGKAVGVTCKNGQKLPADLVIVGVGAAPNTSLVAGQLDTNEAGCIIVDSNMRTSIPNIYAVGDVAAFPLKLKGGELTRVEHVDHARKSAVQAVSAILDPANTKPYDYMPYFYSRVFSLAWQFYGQNVGDAVVYADETESGLVEHPIGAYWVKDGCVVGAFLEGGKPEEYAALAKIVREQPPCASLQKLKSVGLRFATDASGYHTSTWTSWLPTIGIIAAIGITIAAVYIESRKR
eukprot:jgi/Chlat1/7128/Chrsp57S06804